MRNFNVKPIINLLELDINHLVAESTKEGFRFLVRLVDDYQHGINTFQKTGEVLYGVFNEANIVMAVGGLNVDPFSSEEKIGRLRRFYVAKDIRRDGIGTLLLEKIIDDAKNNFDILVLHTDTLSAAAFYTKNGFTQDKRFHNSTHFLQLK